MSTDAWRTPVILAGAQCLERDQIVAPVDLAGRAARCALDAVPGVEGHVEEVHVVGILFGGGRSPASDLCRKLKLTPRRAATTTIGGNTPQWLVTRAAQAVADGAVAAVLIAGAEAVRSQQARAGAAQEPAGDGPSTDGADPVEGDPRPGLSEAEMSAGLAVPAQVYPMIESVLAERAGLSLAGQRRALGELMAPFSQVAAGHRMAWFPQARRPEEISTPADGNRIYAEPYTKRMNAFMGVDQGAALLVGSLGLARQLKVADQAVFIWSGADANDAWFVSQRPDLGASPAIAAAVRAAAAGAGVGIDDIAHFDLYSCFPAAVEIAVEAIGLRADDPRGLTVTGGLPYFGGPGNNYTTHAIATLTDLLRDGPEGTLGLISGLGWYVTKHSIGIYGSSPPPEGFARGDTESVQATIDAGTVEVVADVAGLDAQQARGEASTVIYDRSGQVTAAPVIARLDDGRRVVARAAESELAGLAGRSLVGARLRVGPDGAYRVEETSEEQVAS
jgi:acetyl-CoA C-acetyltransferase